MRLRGHVPFRKTSLQQAKHFCKLGEDPCNNFYVTFINDYIGEGTFTAVSFSKGDFLLEYRGELISYNEAERREREYPASKGSFLYFFRFNCVAQCIDATNHVGYGRKVNDVCHPKEANCAMKVVEFEGRPHLCLFALTDIPSDHELRFDYGVDSLPWRQKNPVKRPNSRILHSISFAGLQKRPRLNLEGLNETITDEGTLDVLPTSDAAADEVSLPAFSTNQNHGDDTSGSTADEECSTPDNIDSLSAITNVGALGMSPTSDAVEVSPPAFSDPTNQNHGDDTSDSVTEECSRPNNTITDEGTLDVLPTSDAAADEVSLPAFSTNQNHGDDTSGSTADEECSTPDNIDSLSAITNVGALDMSPTSDAVEVSPPAFSDPTNQNHGDDTSDSVTEECSRPNNTITDEGTLDVLPTSDAAADEVSLPAFSTNQNHGDDTSGSTADEECSTPDNICSLKSAINLIETADVSLTSQAVAVVTPIIMTTNRNNESDSISDGIISDYEEHLDEIVPESDVESDDGRLIKVVRNVAKSDCNYGETSAASSPSVSDESDNDESDNDDDYVPDGCKYDSDSDESAVFELFHNSHDISSSTSNKQGNAEEKEDPPTAEVDCQPSTSQRPQSKRLPSKHDRPKRYCPFCSKGFCQGRLKRHILQVHKNIKDVQDALQLDKKGQTLKFSSLRKEGIFLVNKKRMSENSENSENSSLERERQQGDHTLVICSNCKGFYAKEYFAKHKQKCSSQKNTDCSSLPVELFNQSENCPIFTSEVLKKFASDEVGNICKSDPFIIDYGLSIWSGKKGKEKNHETRKSVMQNMRRLALLYLRYKEHADVTATDTGTAMDMFRRSSYKSLEHSINAISKYDDDTVKSGLKIALKFLIPNAAGVLESNYLIAGEDAKAEEVAKFITVFNMKKKSLFCDASYQIEKARQTKLRKPSRLPLETDLIKVRSYTRDTMSNLVNDKNLIWDSQNFRLLRDSAVARLTLFNARRGGEPCRLLLQEWEDAEKGAWVDQTLTAKLDSLEKKLLKTTKIAYQAGKGNKLVSLLIPQDTIPALRKLADSSVRAVAGVHSDNVFLFAYTQMSPSHPSGWQCVNKVSKSAEVQCVDNLTATSVRHRTSTLFAAMDLPNFERQQFYKHMGHAEGVNETSYQAPLAVTAVVKVGKQLHRIDQGNIESQCNSEPEDSSFDDYDDASTELNQEPGVSAGVKDVSPNLTEGKRSYFKWKRTSTREVTEHFKKYIHKDGERCCGELPGVDELQAFLKHSDILNEIPEEKRKIQLLRTKIFNERKSFRSQITSKIVGMLA